jgi:hypothetical protein
MPKSPSRRRLDRSIIKNHSPIHSRRSPVPLNRRKPFHAIQPQATPMTTPLGPLVDGQSRLRSGYQSLAQTWADVKEDWRDQRRTQFEREYLAPLGPSLTRLSHAVDDLVQQIIRADQELAESYDENS